MACAAEFDVGLLPGTAVRKLDAYRVLWPQRWTFFTGLGRDVVVAYRVGDDGLLTRAHERVRWTDEVGGLGRAGESRLVEVRRVAFEVPDRYWQRCGQLVDGRCQFQPDFAHPYRVENPLPGAGLCGRVAVAVERVTPPTVGHLPAPPRHVYRIAVVELRCTA